MPDARPGTRRQRTFRFHDGPSAGAVDIADPGHLEDKPTWPALHDPRQPAPQRTLVSGVEISAEDDGDRPAGLGGLEL